MSHVANQRTVPVCLFSVNRSGRGLELGAMVRVAGYQKKVLMANQSSRFGIMLLLFQRVGALAVDPGGLLVHFVHLDFC